MAARGNFDFGPLPFYGMHAGLRTEFGALIPPGANVAAYVRSTGVQDFDDSEVRKRLVSTLDAGLAKCRSGMGDVVLVLPGHAENVSSADQMSSLVAGTKIIGLGHGNLRPTFTWSAAAATFLLDVANVSLENCILNLAGSRTATTALTVAAPITVSAAGCAIRGCEISFGVDADQLVTIGITTTAAADDFCFEANHCFGATAAECTTFLQLVGADRAKLISNRIVGATSAVGVGLIRFLTTASTDVTIRDLHIRNNKALSTAAITGMAGISGEADGLFMVVLSDALAALTGAFGTPASFVFGRQCYVANNIAERAALFGTESA